MNYKKFQRLDHELKDFEKGLHFSNSKGDYYDLSQLKTLNIAVDTIKQLYSGTIDRRIIQSLDFYSSDGGTTITKDEINNENHLYLSSLKAFFDLKITKMGKRSGYQYKLQNSEVGIVILLKSFHKPFDQQTSHLKIELSPHFLAKYSAKEAQKIMDGIAKQYLQNATPCGVAPHICVDLQGWEMPNHMQDDIISRSKQVRTYNGIDAVQFNGFDYILSTFGRNETLMVGSPKSLQLSIYRKDIEIKKSDKVDHYHELWDELSLGCFNKNESVTRVEYRFHHSVIKEFERGIGEDINSYLEVSQYLNNLWKYALETIRYQLNEHIAPIWQYLLEDISFNPNSLTQGFKRQQKEKKDTTAISRNIGLFIGNYLTIRSRSKVPFKYIQKEIQNMEVMNEIRNYLFDKQQEEGMFFEQLKQRYLEKLTATKYAL